jgi:AraC-like DNA-binding protein
MGTSSAHREASPGDFLRRQIEGYQATALIYAAVNLGLPDHMQDGDWNIDQLAEDLDCPIQGLHRVLRALTAIGICEQPNEDIYRLTQAGALLSTDSSSPHRELVKIAVEQYWNPWANLADCVRSGQPAFERLQGMSPWQWRSQHVAQGVDFNSWLAKETTLAAHSVLEAVDFSVVHRLADIGGGSGGLVAKVLEVFPHLTGVLFDQPHVIDQARQALGSQGLLGRVELSEGDFFRAIPVKADLYLLKSILHDWNDACCETILRNCRSAMSPGSRLLVIERMLGSSPHTDSETVMIDIRMMLITGGRERMLFEYEQLLRKSGLKVSKIVPARSGLSVIEAIPQ